MRGSAKGKFVIAAIIAAVSLFLYYRTTSENPITGEKQHVDMSVEQEIALGLQAAPQMAEQFGGLDPDPKLQRLVDEVGNELVRESAAANSDYKFEFHVLADPRTINAFALPGGQIFVTRGLLAKLQTKGELAGVLGHEIGHVVGRHGAEHMAKARLTQGLTGAAVIASYDPDNPSSMRTAAVAAMIGQLVNLKYGRDDELESDKLGVRFISEAGYDPNSMIGVMQALKAAGGGRRQAEFFSTHPDPEDRIARIKQAIKERFPQGVPQNLQR